MNKLIPLSLKVEEIKRKLLQGQRTKNLEDKIDSYNGVSPIRLVITKEPVSEHLTDGFSLGIK